MSAYTPPVTDMGLLALTPVKRRKMRSAGKFGDSAQAIVKIVKRKKVPIMSGFLPYVSDKGPKRRGPRT